MIPARSRSPAAAARAGLLLLVVLGLAGGALSPARVRGTEAPAVPVLEEIRIVLPDTHTQGMSVRAGQAPPETTTHEVARCRVLVWITADGIVRAGQVIGPSGTERLDAACLEGVMGRKLEPSRVLGQAIDSWAVIPLVFASTRPLDPRTVRHAPGAASVPELRSDQQMHVQAPYYPAGAVARGEQGDCTVRVRVSATGHLEDLKVTRSAGSADLDAGCLAAIYAAHFAPAQQGAERQSAITDVVLHWQLPR